MIIPAIYQRTARVFSVGSHGAFAPARSAQASLRGPQTPSIVLVILLKEAGEEVPLVAPPTAGTFCDAEELCDNP